MFHFPDQLFEIPSTWLDVPHEQIQAGRTTELVNTADKFKLNLAVEGYRPEELDVKVVRDRFLVVHGKHGERKETEGATGFRETRIHQKLRDTEWSGFGQTEIEFDG
jgi:HSP20 family molecular chaperone IbpA